MTSSASTSGAVLEAAHGLEGPLVARKRALATIAPQLNLRGSMLETAHSLGRPPGYQEAKGIRSMKNANKKMTTVGGDPKPRKSTPKGSKEDQNIHQAHK